MVLILLRHNFHFRGWVMETVFTIQCRLACILQSLLSAGISDGHHRSQSQNLLLNINRLKKYYFFLLLYMYVCVHAHVHMHMCLSVCRDQDTVWQHQFSPSTFVQVLGIKLGLSVLHSELLYPLSHLIGPSLLFRSVMLSLISFYVDPVAMQIPHLLIKKGY